MRVLVHVPFASSSQEAGIVFLLANYLRKHPGGEVAITQLQCNGVFAMCDRDAERNWKRGIHSCLSCIRDQRSYGQWGELESDQLSKYLTDDDITRTKRWVQRMSAEQLPTAEFDGVELGPLWLGSFSARFGAAQYEPQNKLHEPTARRFSVGAARMLLASRRLLTRHVPDALFIAGGDDFLTRTLSEVAKAQQIPVVRFQWVLAERSVRIYHPHRDEVLACELLVDGLTSTRSDPRTWSGDLLRILDGVVEFLELIPQEPLSAAR